MTGYSVAPAGDFDGDGYKDLLIGSPFNSMGAVGLAYVIYGGPTFPTSGLVILPNFTIAAGFYGPFFDAGMNVAGGGVCFNILRSSIHFLTC